MKVELSKKEKTFFGFLFIGVFFFALGYSSQGQFNLPLAWVLGLNGESVDSDNNGQVDMADDSEKLGGLDSSDFLNAAGDTVSGGGEAFCVSGTNSYYTRCDDINIPGYSRFDNWMGYTCCFLKNSVNNNGKRIFVTSIGYNGNLGGEIGADQKCQDRADVANLGGTFKAWLLDGTHETKIYNKFQDSTYYNMLGQKVITTFIDYNSGYTGFNTLENKINYDEFGRVISVYYDAWTGLDYLGEIISSSTSPYGTTYTCSSFTSSYNSAYSYGSLGNVFETGYQWFAHGQLVCSEKARLICVET